MKRDVIEQASKYTEARQRKKRWYQVIICLAAAVVFCTTYALILPAVTMEKGQCQLPEHTHTEACYTQVTSTTEKKLVCSLKRLKVHEHTEDCYDEEDQLICGYADFVVHEHDKSCYDEDGELWCPLPEIKAHTHEDSCYVSGKAEAAHTHTEDCYTQERGALVCEIEESEGHTHTDACYKWEKVLTCQQSTQQVAAEPKLICDQEEIILHEHTKDCFDKDGSLICGKTEVLEHVHSEDCFENVEKPVDTEALTCTTPKGEGVHTHGEDCYDENGDLTCQLEESEGHQHGPLCYGTWELTCGMEEHTHTEACEPAEGSPSAIQMPSEFHYENDDISLALHVDGAALLAEATGEAEPTGDDGAAGTAEKTGNEETTEDAGEDESAALEDEESVMVVTLLKEDDPDYQAFAAYAEESGDGAVLSLSAMSLEFYYQGQRLDVSDCTMTAKITPKEPLVTAAEKVTARLSEEAAPEAEVGVVLTALEAQEGVAAELDNALIEPGETSTVLTASVDGDNPILAVAATETANPKFQVQYYAYLDVAAATGTNPLDIIDTSGGKLPTNGNSGLNKKDIYLEAATNGKYKVATTQTLTEVYRGKDCEYISAPNLTYFNSLYENGCYELKEIWVLKKDKDASSINSDDWDVYDPSEAHFTNRPETAASSPGTTILIQDNTVIRLVFDTTKSDYMNSASFYDYDITDDGRNTFQHGINSASNYSGGGAKLAFGNANTGTGLADQVWSGNQLNQYNRNGNSYKGCTFGLVNGLTDGKIQYSDGVIAPKLFNDGTAIGKTTYDKGEYSLNFNRAGDTYTLTAVQSAGLSELEYFNHPVCGNTTYNNIWTNNFWPMDEVKNKDPHTGAYGNVGTYESNGQTRNYPVSDDGQAHNNMFGMHYSVNFKLTEDYTGPLEYYFFGDDDMWVFLDDKLVCDIGGVHSSVGEYVNLWDYIEKGSAGEYTLTFFYTERGLSGSTCYMQFTLPSVSSVTPDQNTGALRVAKKVEGSADSSTEFTFSINFTDASGNRLQDDYSYTRYNSSGTEIGKDLIISDGGTFSLKADEYIIVKYLPYGTKYTIQENETDGGKLEDLYVTSNMVNNTLSENGTIAEGSILSGEMEQVVFTNTVRPMLPQTGGPGTLLYTCGGLALILAGVLMYRMCGKRKEGM